MITKYRSQSHSSTAAAFPQLPPQHTAPTRKRTHLKPSQVAVLQESFVTNPLPDAAIRSRLARELGVTERTIQIWFQNRRAKARKLEAVSNIAGGKSGANKIPCLMPNVRTGWIEPPCHGTPQRYQATFRTMMTPERFEELQQQQHHQDDETCNTNSSNSLRRRARSCSNSRLDSTKAVDFDLTTARAVSEGADRWLSKQGTTATNTSSIPFPVTSLRVGLWSRFTSNPIDRQEYWDLFCYAQERQLTWQIQDGGHQFRMQIDFDAIQQLVLSSEMRDDMTMVDQLAIHLYHPGDLTFSMWRTGIDTDWVRCGDFSENKQATFDAVHVLQGIHESLRQPLLQLFNRAPDLFSKCTMDSNTSTAANNNNGSVPPLDLCRSFTLSPSATPEPAIASFQPTNTNGSGSQEEWMMHQADTTNSLLTAAVAADGKPSAMDCWAQPAAWNWSNMLQQPSITFTAPSSNNNPLADFM
ncbi:homeobox-domain-containing protein [Lichtheimia hyalospora FSU 10163]|nr:homeobox-domain-containing protein [Lichtheimia hyalospora FSU 10163]